MVNSPTAQSLERYRHLRQAQLIYGIEGNATILYWINQSRGLRGYEKRTTSLANFAETKKNIHDKKLEEENKETFICFCYTNVEWQSSSEKQHLAAVMKTSVKAGLLSVGIFCDE